MQITFDKFKSSNFPSLTRQKINPIRKEFIKENKCSFGAYELSRTNQEVGITIFASGSEVNLAINASHKLAKYKIYSKVISVPSLELFKLQSKSYKNKVLNETKFKISIEAASTDCWKKFVGENGMCFGIDIFGKSAPYKDIYKFYGLTSENISKEITKLIKKKWKLKLELMGWVELEDWFCEEHRDEGYDSSYKWEIDALPHRGAYSVMSSCSRVLSNECARITGGADKKTDDRET